MNRKLRQTGFSNLTCAQTVATVFVFFYLLCPFAFAIERGKQEGKRVTREIVSRVVGAERADSLLAQIEAMRIDRFMTIGNTASGAVSFEAPGFTYVLKWIASDADGRLSSLIDVYDSNGEKTGELEFLDIVVADDNQLNFSVGVSTATESLTVAGALVGVQNDPGTAVATINVDGGDSNLALVDFSAVVPADSLATASVATLSLPVVTSLPGTDSSDGGVASWIFGIIAAIIEVITFGMLVTIAAAAVLFVGATCLAFGWWGCDGYWL